MGHDVGRLVSKSSRHSSEAATHITKRPHRCRESGLGAIRRWLLAGAVAAAGLAGLPLHAQTAPPSRVALVIGIGGDRAAPTPAAPDDAGLVAQTLQGAGFDVTAARDLDGNGLRQAFRDFLDKAAASGPDGIAVVYLAGRAVQADGDNFFVPVDAKLARAADVPIETVRLGDFTHALAALPIQAKVVVVDAAYAGGLATAPTGGPAATAPGFALVDAEQGELIAFNAAPGSVAPATQGPYGVYAQALVQGMKQGGVPVSEIFDRVRLSVSQTTGGAEIPWDSDKLTRSFTFFDRGPDAPAVASAQIPFAALEKRPIRDFPPDQAYDVAIARDTLPAYQDFLAAFPDNPLGRRIRLIVAVRREALFWRATLRAGSPAGFWTYLDRYPQGPHVPDARRRLARLAAAAGPPPDFRPLAYDVPPPPPGDIVVFDRPVIFYDPGLPPPPPPPVFLLPPPVVVVLPPPPPPRGPRFLPIPAPIPIPGVRPIVEPGVIAPPRGIGGVYGRPRPYRRGPGGDGLVGQDSPESPPPGSGQPPVPPPASPPPMGRPLPPGSGPNQGRPLPPNAPAPLVTPPAPSPAAPPPAGRPGVTPNVPPPAGRPLPSTALPVPAGHPAKPLSGGAAPGRQVPPPAAPPATEPPPLVAPRPIPAPSAEAHPSRPRQPNAVPGGAAPPRATRLPLSAVPPSGPGPDINPPRPSHPPAQPNAAPVAAPLRPVAPPEAQPRPPGGPRPMPAPDAAPRPAPPPHPAAPLLQAAPPRPVPSTPAGGPPGMAPSGPRPPGLGGGQPPGASGHPGGQGRPACGHPGEPPCR